MLLLWVRVICGLLWFFSMHNIFNFKGFISSNISLAMSCFRLWLCTNVGFWVCGSFVPVHFPEFCCYFERKDWNSCQHQSSILCPKPVCSLVFHSAVSMGFVYLSGWILGPEVALCRVSWRTVPPPTCGSSSGLVSEWGGVGSNYRNMCSFFIFSGFGQWHIKPPGVTPLHSHEHGSHMRERSKANCAPGQEEEVEDGIV